MIKALIFDVFGTLVDWRHSIAREAETLLGPEGISIDWLLFSDLWRDEYQPAMELVRAGEIPFSKLDQLHMRNLEIVLNNFNITGLNNTTKEALNHAWHRLDAWPDVKLGLDKLRSKYLLAPCSNGNISLMVDLARYNDLRWDAILGAEIARDYKPKPVVYLSSADAFGLQPDEVMMVAAHSNDLDAAQNAGLKTAFISRPYEYKDNLGERYSSIKVDYSADTLLDLADQLKC